LWLAGADAMSGSSSHSDGASQGGRKGRSGSSPQRRRIAATGAGFTLAGAFYLLLIDTTSLPELYVGAAVGLLAGVVFEAAREQTFPEATIALSWLCGAWRAVRKIPPDILRVSLSAFEQLVSPNRRTGRLRVVEFRHGHADCSRDAGRRALAEAFGSLAPNTIVIGVDPDRNVLLAHQLRVHDDEKTIDVLGLG
jgi:multisubunit Na+/H+ antiporter MnhE subunit